MKSEVIGKKDNIVVSWSFFERLMTNCCNQNNCLDTPDQCLCCKECDVDLKELLDSK